MHAFRQEELTFGIVRQERARRFQFFHSLAAAGGGEIQENEVIMRERVMRIECECGPQLALCEGVSLLVEFVEAKILVWSGELRISAQLLADSERRRPATDPIGLL